MYAYLCGSLVTEINGNVKLKLYENLGKYLNFACDDQFRMWKTGTSHEMRAHERTSRIS